MNLRMHQSRILQVVSFLILLLGSPRIWAQSGHLEVYLDSALSQNLTLLERNLSYEKSLEALNEAKGLFFPQISFQAAYTLAGGGRAIEFPVGDLINPIYQTLNDLTASQNFPTNLENVNEQFLPNNFHETKLRVIQPLFNSDIYYNYKARKELISLESVKREAYEKELVREVKTAYYRYLKTEEVLTIYADTRGLLEEILRVNQRLVENNKATYDVVYSAEYEISKIDKQLALANQDRKLAAAWFNFLLNRDQGALILRDALILNASDVRNLDLLEQQAINQRLEFSQLRYARAANARQIGLNKGLALPKVNLVLDIGYQGFGYSFDKNQDFWLGQISLQWDLFKGFQNRAKTQQAYIEGQILSNQQDRLTQQIRLQVKEAWHQYRAAEQAVAASRLGVKSAGAAFRIIQRKYQEDQASLLELMNARTQFTQSKLSLAIDSYDLLSKEAELGYATAAY